MTEIKDIKRPGVALIKLVEATGILLETEIREKSHYKVPSPSCYDSTIELLSQNYNQVIDKLVNIKIDGISNDQAHSLYEKILEPGFDYDEAVINGGSRCRELFDLVYYLLSQLQIDANRHPVQANNVYVIIDGKRTSYLALDIAAHMFNHGVCIAGVIDIVDSDGFSKKNGFAKAISLDVERRFSAHYKLQAHRHQVNLIQSLEEEMLDNLKQSIHECDASIVVSGIYEHNHQDKHQHALISWMLWECNLTAVIVKGQTSPRPFDVVITPKTCMIYLHEESNVLEYLTKASVCMRATDNFVVLVIVDDSTPAGDLQDNRFGYGSRSGWIDELHHPSNKNIVGWNNSKVDEMVAEVEKFIASSRMNGRLRREVKSKHRPLSQDVCKYATHEASEVIVLGREHNHRDFITECIQSTESATIVVIK